MEYFIVVLSIIVPFINFISNFFRNKKNQSFLFLISMCAAFQLILGPFNMLGFQNYFVYSVLTYILFIFGIISGFVYTFFPLFKIHIPNVNLKKMGFVYTFFPLFKIKKDKNYLANFRKNFLDSFLKSFLIPWVILIIVSVFCLFFQSHFWDSTGYKLVSLNFRDGLYQFGGLGGGQGNGDDPYFTYKISAGYYVSSALSTENIAFMYNYVWVIIFYSFFIFFIWDFFGEFISDRNVKKSIIGRTILLISTMILVFLHHYRISAANVIYASVLILLAIYCIKKNNFLSFFLSILFVEFFTVTGYLIVLPFVLGYFIYILIFKKVKDLINFILLFAITMVGSLSLFVKPNVNVANASLIVFSLYLIISIVFLICYLPFNLKANQDFLFKKIINVKTNFYTKKNFIISSICFWMFVIVLFLTVFYISQDKEAISETLSFAWSITGVGMAVIYYSIYIYFYRKKISLSNAYVYQLIQVCSSTIFLLVFYLIGNYVVNIWNSSTWRLLMTIPGADYPYAIFAIGVPNLFYLFKNFNFESWKAFFKKTHIKNKKWNNINKINKNLIILGLTCCTVGTTATLGFNGSLAASYDTTVITTNVDYLNDFNEDQKKILTQINNCIKSEPTFSDYSKNLILADTPVFEYIRCAYDWLGFKYNYTNYGEALDKLYSTNYDNSQLWNFFEGPVESLLGEESGYNFKMIILDVHTNYYSLFSFELSQKLLNWNCDKNSWYEIWYTKGE